MASYRILPSFAGEFTQGQIVTEEQVKASGADLGFWKLAGILEPVTVLAQSDTPPDAPGAHQEQLDIAGLPADTQGEIADVTDPALQEAVAQSQAAVDAGAKARDAALSSAKGKTATADPNAGA